MRRFLVCIHDATPAHDRETRIMIRGLAPLLGRRFSLGVVPNWHGQWPLSAHPEYCSLLTDSCEELLLHGCFHWRRRGCGPATLLSERSDEMNGLDVEETRRTVERGQQVFTRMFGAPACGFLAPAWQRGQVRVEDVALGLGHVLGFFRLDSQAGERIPLATSTWDCGRWGWLGYLGHSVGRVLQTLDRGVPVLAVHPRDLERGFWPHILQSTRMLLEKGYEPTTAASLLEAPDRGTKGRGVGEC
jgi:hypothetical protein